jgi:uncharacterized membrane protein YdbT with pleckstrin-like domain
MLSLNQKYHLPEKYLWFILSELSFMAAIILFFMSIYDLSFGVLAFWIYAFLIIIPAIIYFQIYNYFFSFTVNAGAITVNTGILIQRSKSLSFRNIQNIEIVQGFIESFFNISTINIWTASPGQAAKNGKIKSVPDISLILDSKDADWLKNFILNQNEA